MATLGLKEMGKILLKGRGKGKGKDKKITKLLVLAVEFEPTTIELTEWSPNQFCHLVIEMSGKKYLSMSIQCTFLSPPYSLPSQRNFPISFKPKVAIARF